MIHCCKEDALLFPTMYDSIFESTYEANASRSTAVPRLTAGALVASAGYGHKAAVVAAAGGCLTR